MLFSLIHRVLNTLGCIIYQIDILERLDHDIHVAFAHEPATIPRYHDQTQMKPLIFPNE